MTHRNNYRLSHAAVEVLMKEGWEAIPEMNRIVVYQAMREERSRYLQAEAYGRTVERKGYANGSRPESVKTWVGETEFAIPQLTSHVMQDCWTQYTSASIYLVD